MITEPPCRTNERASLGRVARGVRKSQYWPIVPAGSWSLAPISCQPMSVLPCDAATADARPMNRRKSSAVVLRHSSPPMCR